MKISKRYIKSASNTSGIIPKVGITSDTDIDELEDVGLLEDFDGISDDLEELSDSVDDLQDSIDDVNPDPINIEMYNNIADHYIAECDLCQGVFITSLMESDAHIDSIHGICPICNQESEQFIKWIVKSVEEV